MQYLAAYTLAALSGKQPSKDQVSAILTATGSPVDDGQVQAVMESLKGKDIAQLISSGFGKIGSGGAPASGKAAETKKADNKKEDKKKEEKKPEKAKEPEPPKQEDEDEDFNLDLFG